MLEFNPVLSFQATTPCSSIHKSPRRKRERFAIFRKSIKVVVVENSKIKQTLYLVCMCATLRAYSSKLDIAICDFKMVI